MIKIEPTDAATRSVDIVPESIEGLRVLFPSAFLEGGLDFGVLRELLGGALEERDEKFGLSWHGKRQARQLALTPTTGTLRPQPTESVAWQTTQNLILEGDNLEVLKLLQKSYAGKVKVIYTDPPYNTGGEFIYPDDFRDNVKNYLELTGQTDGAGRKLTSNTQASGRFHTDWLNMMYPRLKLAHSLLHADGVLFVSIDDNEVAHLRMVLDELFGAENFIATVIWQKVYAPKSTARHFSEDHDYVVVYAKRASTWTPNLLPRTAEQDSHYTNPDGDARGPWRVDGLSARNYYSKGLYQITTPGGRLVTGPPSGRYWTVSEERFRELDADNRIHWGADGNNQPGLKRFLSEVRDGRVPQTLWTYEEVGHTQEAKKELLELVPFESSDSVFDTPKPLRMLSRILKLATNKSRNDLVLDFFAGSGTTGHAVLAANAADGGNRRFILVQLPEPTGATDYPTLSALTRDRVRRAGQRLGSEQKMFPVDVGFRAFALDSSNIRPWDPRPADLDRQLLDALEHIRPGRDELDVLTEVLLKLGLELTVPITTRVIVGKTAYAVASGVLLVCLDPQIARGEVEGLALGLIGWHRELAPATETTLVFRDSAFQDDVAKCNLTAILQQHGLRTVRSL